MFWISTGVHPGVFAVLLYIQLEKQICCRENKILPIVLFGNLCYDEDSISVKEYVESK